MVPKNVMFTSMMAITFITAQKYIPTNLLHPLSRYLVMTVPKMEPIGKIPINTDWAVKVSIEVISYYNTILLIGTEVISLRLYPYIKALRQMINPMTITLASLFNLTLSVGEGSVGWLSCPILSTVWSTLIAY